MVRPTRPLATWMFVAAVWATGAAGPQGWLDSSVESSQTSGSAVVAGQVVDATTGRPVGGAVVTLALGTPPPANPTGQPPLPAAAARRGIAVAAADGRFVFRDVPAGVFSLTATRNGYASGATGRRRPGGPGRSFTLEDRAQMTDAVIQVWPLASIAGTVRDDRGDPAVGVAVWARRYATNSGRPELTLTGGSVDVTDERGRYRLANLMPGSYVVSVTGATQSVAVSTVDAYQAAVVSGTAREMLQSSSGTGMLNISSAGFIVDGWQASVSGSAPGLLPGSDGRLLVHPTTFHAQAASAADATVLTLEPGDERVGIDIALPLLPGVRVSGTLQAPDGPAARHGLRLLPAWTSGPFTDVPIAYGTSDEAGRFTLLGVPPGAYVLRAYRRPATGPVIVPPQAGGPPITRVEMDTGRSGPEQPTLYADVAVTVGSTHVDDVFVVLQPGARLRGRVAFEGTTPPPAAAQLQQVSISIRPLNSSMPFADARVEPDGRFTTPAYPPGRFAVFAVRPPSAEWTLASVRVAGEDVAGRVFDVGMSDIDGVVVTFTDSVMTLSGTVRSPDGGAEEGASVLVFPADVRAWLNEGMLPGRVATAVSSATGEYRLQVPFPDDYLIVALAPEITPDVTIALLERVAASAVRLRFQAGETKTQPLTAIRFR